MFRGQTELLISGQNLTLVASQKNLVSLDRAKQEKLY